MKMNREEFEKVNVFGLGNANETYAKYFLGESYLNSLTKAVMGYFWQMLHLNLVVEIIGDSSRHKWWLTGFNMHCWLWLVSNCW